MIVSHEYNNLSAAENIRASKSPNSFDVQEKDVWMDGLEKMRVRPSLRNDLASSLTISMSQAHHG